MQENLSPQKIEEGLRHFHGTTEWYRIHPNVLLTEGVKYLAESCEAYWFIDCIASYQTIDKVAREEFQTIDLTASEDATAVITVGDGNDNELFRQEIPFTTFPLRHIRVYYTDGVVMLPSEY